MTPPEEDSTISGAAPQPRRDLRPIAAFDFDGTLTVEDSFTAFLRWRAGPVRWWIGLAGLLPEALVYLVRRDRGRLKSASIRTFLGGLSRADLSEEAARFASSQAPRLLRPDAIRAWEAHRALGHRLVIVSASPEDILAPFALRLQATSLIGSRLAWTDDDRIGGGLKGRNCRGAEKVRRLKEMFGDDVVVADAYGDTAGDREMLAFAERAHMRLFDQSL